MSHDQESVRDRQVKDFIKNLSELNDGEWARLKRNAGNTLAESHQVRLLFYQKILPHGVSSLWQEERYFLIATLYPFDKKERNKNRQPASNGEDEHEDVKNTVAFTTSLGNSFRQARSDQNETGLSRRFARLLDTDIQQLHFQLRQAIMRLTADWIYINWEQLTKDVLGWESASQYVQRNWARDYVAAKPENQ